MTETLRDILESIGVATVFIAIVALGVVIFNWICNSIDTWEDRRKDKKSSKFGKYPSCDHLNNAIRYLQNSDTDNAMIEIIFAIDKSDGYFHKENEPIVEAARKAFWEKHSG